MQNNNNLEIKGILVTLLAPMEDHIANGGEKLLGNVSSIKRRPDEKVYISGQMQRNALFKAIERLNFADENRGTTYVSNGDGIGYNVETNIRSDLGGFMHPRGGNYSGRRTSPLSVTPAVSINESEIGKDLLLRLRTQDREHSLATNEYSQEDLMNMNFFLDIGSVSVSKKFNYENEFHVDTDFVKHVNEKERERRVKLFLEASRSITDYANQARNAVCGEPQQVLIVFDTKLSRKASRFFNADDKEKENILKELKNRKAKYFIGDDKGVLKGDNEQLSVDEAYNKALEFFRQENVTLFDPCGGDNNIVSFEKAFGSLLAKKEKEDDTSETDD